MIDQDRPRRRSPLPTLALLSVSLLVMLFASGCGGNVAAAEISPAQAAAKSAASPDQVRQVRQLLINHGCIGCHTIGAFPEAIGTVGPNLTHIATEVEQSILPSAEYKASGGAATNVGEYLYESIIVPALYVAPDCPNGDCPNHVMPENFADQLSNDEINLIVDVFSTFR